MLFGTDVVIYMVKKFFITDYLHKMLINITYLSLNNMSY